MIIVGNACSKCIHKRDNINGWICACDAFPEGIPDGVLFWKNMQNVKECNNGIGYEPDPDLVKLFEVNTTSQL
jgi:hypothetical protein